MGKHITPKFVVVLDGKADQAMSWYVKDYGQANEKSLEAFVMAYAKSLESGGANAHLSEGLGHIPYPRTAEIRLNFTCGATVAEWKAGAFQVYG
jgi:membrane-bound lytic murein transglycosylase MltF